MIILAINLLTETSRSQHWIAYSRFSINNQDFINSLGCINGRNYYGVSTDRSRCKIGDAEVTGAELYYIPF